MSSNTKVQRRRFLCASSTLLALPWLESISLAANPEPPKRIINICTSFGFYGPAFFPEDVGPNYKPTEYLKILKEYRNDMTVFSGISHPEIGGDHASEACFLTSAKHPTQPGFQNSISMDVLAASTTYQTTRFPLITLSTHGSSPLSHTESGANIPAWNSPSKLYAKLFLTGNEKEQQQNLTRLHRGKSVLDRMKTQLQKLNSSVSQSDKHQIAAYTDAVRELEQQLVAEEKWIHLAKPTVDIPQPKESYPSPFADPSDSIGRANVMLNLSKLAIQTDSTRIISLFIRGMDDRPPIDGVSEGHHGLSHHGQNQNKIEQLKTVEKSKLVILRDFLSSLKNSVEGDSNLLDSTQVLIGSNLGNASSHNTNNLPIILAGGGWQHGAHIAGDAIDNTPLAELFVSMLQKHGVKTNEFGSGTKPIPGLN